MAKPNGSSPATSSRANHASASKLRHPGPRATPPRPLTAHHHALPSPAPFACRPALPRARRPRVLVCSSRLSSPLSLGLPLPFAFLFFLLSVFRFVGLVVVSLDHLARPL